jgi:hypothetical protein
MVNVSKGLLFFPRISPDFVINFHERKLSSERENICGKIKPFFRMQNRVNEMIIKCVGFRDFIAGQI